MGPISMGPKGLWAHEVFDIKSMVIFVAMGAVLLSMVGAFLRSKKCMICSIILLVISNAIMILENTSLSWLSILIACDSLLLAAVGIYTKEKIYIWCAVILMVIANIVGCWF